MKSAKLLWILPIAVSCMVQAQVQAVVKLETSYINDHPVSKADTALQPANTSVDVQPAAFFLGSEVASKLATGAALDDGLLAAYQAIAAAKARIESNSSCQKFFHGEGEQALDRTRFTMQYLQIPDIAAQVDGSAVLLNRSSNGLFMKPPQAFMGLNDPKEIRAFYILHELAHELYRYTKYVTDHSASADTSRFRTLMNNELLFQNCYKNLRPLIAAR